MELRRSGTLVKIREQSFNILVFLLEHAGELVNREDLRRVFWPSDTFVDFDDSLITAVMKLREALGDPADAPLYIETIPKRGYRFIAPVEAMGNGPATSEKALRDTPVIDAPVSPVPLSPVLPPRKGRTVRIGIAFATCLLLAGAGWFVYKRWHPGAPASPVQRSLTRLTFDEGLQTGATWSPDGRFIAYSLRSRRKVRYLGPAGQRRRPHPVHQRAGPEHDSPTGLQTANTSPMFRGGRWRNLYHSGSWGRRSAT